jgi:class 3 adenylate cyclase
VQDLPVGTVTFVFTDIEGSTRLLKELAGRYKEVLARHRELVREALERHGGREIDTQGEGFFLVFHRAKDAVAAAVTIQRAHGEEDWPQGADVRVRIGVHTSEPELADASYVGLGVHRAARIGAVGHGGQVLVSRSTAGLVDEEESPEVEVRDLGEHELKGFDRVERIYQVVAPGIATEFPPLLTLTGIARAAEAALPTGTITFFVTDVVGSTRLIAEAGPEEAVAIVEDYERILREAVEQAEGRIFEIAGDSIITTFTRPNDAVRAAVGAMSALARNWRGADRVQVRAGVHTGETASRGARYVGLALPRTFRVCAAAAAGQALVSETTESLLDSSLLTSVTIREVGVRDLDDFDRPIRLYELVV